MATLFTKTVSRLRQSLGREDQRQGSDRQLLERFAATGDEQAFTTVVQRHGPLVLGVCRRVLGNDQDAEDAFQAAFLVLARKAASLPWQDSVKNWLYGVAFRVAKKAGVQAARRRKRERLAAEREALPPPTDTSWGDYRAVLDEELALLPQRYRAPLLLCYLEGKTRDEAAEELGWSAGSVKGRLERGRELLRQRLLRRGLPLGGVLCASLLSGGSASAAPTSLLIHQTIQSSLGFLGYTSTGAALAPNVLYLAQGVLHAMILAKIKTAFFALLCLGLLALGGWCTHQALVAREPDQDAAQAGRRAPDQEGQKDRPREGKGRDQDQPKETMQIPGVFRSADAAKNTITVIAGGDAIRAEQTYNLAKKLAVTLSTGQTIKLADLTPRTLLLLQLDAKDEVQAIRVALPTLNTVLIGVDAEKNTITLRWDREDKDKELPVAKDARLQQDGRQATLKDFKAGARVQLVLSLDRGTVVAMQVGGRETPRKEERPREAPPERGRANPTNLIGVVVGVDAAKNSVEILAGAEDNLAIQTYELAKDADVQVRLGRTTQKLTLAQLPKAVRVHLQLSPDKKTIVQLEAHAPTLRVVITEVDPAGKKLSFRSESGVKDLPLAPDAVLQLPGQENAKLADLTRGQPVLLQLNLDRSQILGVSGVRPERERQ